MKIYFSRIFEHLLSPINLFVTASAIIFLTFAGPFGTFETMSYFQRFSYWSIVVLAGVLVVTFLKIAIEMRLSHLSHSLRSLILAASMAIILSPIVHGISIAMTSAYREVSPLWTVAVVVFFVSLFIYQLHIIIMKLEIGPKPVPRFSQRIGASGDCTVYHVAVDDHYLNIRAENGEHRLLMRFSDALTELEELGGMQVHRSHWVSECSIRHVRKENSKMHLELVDGSVVPVSRAYQDEVHARLERSRRG